MVHVKVSAPLLYPCFLLIHLNLPYFLYWAFKRNVNHFFMLWSRVVSLTSFLGSSHSHPPGMSGFSWGLSVCPALSPPPSAHAQVMGDWLARCPSHPGRETSYLHRGGVGVGWDCRLEFSEPDLPRMSGMWTGLAL